MGRKRKVNQNLTGPAEYSWRVLPSSMVAGNGQKQSVPAPPGLILSPPEIPANFHQVTAEMSEKMRAMWQTTIRNATRQFVLGRHYPAGPALQFLVDPAQPSPAQPDNERPMHIVIRPG